MQDSRKIVVAGSLVFVFINNHWIQLSSDYYHWKKLSPRPIIHWEAICLKNHIKSTFNQINS